MWWRKRRKPYAPIADIKWGLGMIAWLARRTIEKKNVVARVCRTWETASFFPPKT